MTDEHGPDAPSADWVPFPQQKIVQGIGRQIANDGLPATRKYLPTLADLIDRLSIVQLKEIYIGGDYAAERKLIEEDIGYLLRINNDAVVTGEFIRAVMLVQLTNRVIWESESKARAGGSEQDKLLKFTHSINGIRNRAKNVIAQAVGDRIDSKTDCLAANLPAEFGNWDVFK